MSLVAGDVMQGKVTTVRADASLVDLERTFCDTRQSGFPVVDDEGRLIGVVSRADIVRKLATERSWAEYESDYYADPAESDREPLEAMASRIGLRLGEACVADVMSHDPITTARDTPVAEIARVFTERRIHRLPVVDDGALVGIVTTVDLVRLLADGRVYSR